MMTELVDCPADGPRAGMSLEVAFRDGIPVFRPGPPPPARPAG